VKISNLPFNQLNNMHSFSDCLPTGSDSDAAVFVLVFEDTESVAQVFRDLAT
jgi:hypothetical protein